MVLELLAIVICVYFITNIDAHIKITINRPEQKVEVPVIMNQEDVDKAQDDASSVHDLVRNLNEFMLGDD